MAVLLLGLGARPGTPGFTQKLAVVVDVISGAALGWKLRRHVASVKLDGDGFHVGQEKKKN